MNKEEWHAWRAQGIGASDAAVIMKKFPFGKTPLMLWEEKISGGKDIETEAMRHGKMTEEKATQWVESKLGVEFIRQHPAENPEMPWMRATLDAIDENKKIMVEIKCPFNLDNHYQVKKSGKVPDIYYPQLQHQMKVMNLDSMWFESFHEADPDKGVLIEVKRNGEYINELIREEYIFLQSVVDRIPPPLTDLDYKQRGEGWIRLAEERMKIRRAIKDLEKKDEELQERLIEESEGISSRGAEFRFTKYVSKGRIDYINALGQYVALLQTTFPDLQFPSIDLESFRKAPVTQWKLT